MAVAQLFTAAQCSTSSLAGAELKLLPARPVPLSFSVPGQHCFPCSLLRNGGAGKSSSRGKAAQGFRKRRVDVARRAKFQLFTPSDEPAGALEDLPDLEESEESEEESSGDEVAEDERADRVLPESLEGAILQSSESAALFVLSGGTRAMDFWNMGMQDDPSVGPLVAIKLYRTFSRARICPNEKGDAAGRAMLVEGLPHGGAVVATNDKCRAGRGSIEIVESVESVLGRSAVKIRHPACVQQLKAIFPDAGVAAMLKYQWKDASFTFASLNDRKPVAIGDEVVVLVQPDFQMLSSVEKIASSVLGEADGPPRPLIMFNPALQSGEVGIGLNVRRMKEFFLSTFNPVYSMRTLSFGAIFRRYPGSWQVFFDDETFPGRYLLASEEPTRPVLEDVEMLFLRRGRKGEDGADKEPGALQSLVGMFSSMSRFMQSLSR